MQPFGFDNTFARTMAGFHVPTQPVPVAQPSLLYLNQPLARELGLDPQALSGADGAALFAGNRLPPDAQPVAQVYAGHQFGGFSPQLGDGRAVLIGELVDRHGARRDIAFKGSGRTPFSRGGDGRAAVGPMLREVLISEAMHALGIPTTRALAVAATGETVFRETRLPGAVLTRVAASHLRVGTFQFFAARQDVERLHQLADHAIVRHDPSLAGRDDRHLELLRSVVRRQALLIAQWMNVGFIHGVMNTDNMTISGETIDYGPCAFMEAYDPAAVFSSIDQGGRYAYRNQPGIAQWNLARLAETLLPLIADDPDDEASIRRAIEQASGALGEFGPLHAAALLAGQRAKLGLSDADGAGSTAVSGLPAAAPAADGPDADAGLVHDWLDLLHSQSVDFTLAWRYLADAAEDAEAARLRALFGQTDGLDAWLLRWRGRCAGIDTGAVDEAAANRAARMRQVNPLVIPRNHRVEEALTAATAGDLAPFEQLLAAIRRPYDDDPALADYAQPAPASLTACYQTFCGT